MRKATKKRKITPANQGSERLEATDIPGLRAVLRLTDALRAGTDGSSFRLKIAMIAFAACFAVIAGRMVFFALSPVAPSLAGAHAGDALAAARPDILDRNGEILATDLKTPSLYADPRRIIDVDEAAERLTEVLPELDSAALRAKLASDRAFVFVKREITPRQQAAIHELGIPGIGFLDENRRVYPAANTTAYILGHVNVDNAGIAGIEKYIDDQGLAALHAVGLGTQSTQRPLQLAIDLRVQHSLRDELARAVERYRAIGAAGVIMDVNSGEVLAMTSLPDYDPNQPGEALQADRMNRVVSGVYEIGSVFKTFTAAMVLDRGVADLSTVYDATQPLRVASFTIDDFHGARRPLTLREAFIKSSNIAHARMALQVGREYHREFLRNLGFMQRLRTELPESAAPLIPARWTELTTMTASFGHGISVTPLQVAAAGAAIINGGYYIQPSFLRRSRAQADVIKRRVITSDSSADMRSLFRLNVEKGTAKRAEVVGYRLGGKTGTAEKIVNGRYSQDHRMTSFLGAFPMDAPRYVVLVMLDEPKGSVETDGRATSSLNAVPTAGALVARIAPMLGVVPRADPDQPDPSTIQVSY